jgi:hypothetical protein
MWQWTTVGCNIGRWIRAMDLGRTLFAMDRAPKRDASQYGGFLADLPEKTLIEIG